MSLKELNLRNQYRSDLTDLIQDFYIPCLKQSMTYDRAVGFFSSTSLTTAAQELQVPNRKAPFSVLAASKPCLSKRFNIDQAGAMSFDQVAVVAVHRLQ